MNNKTYFITYGDPETGQVITEANRAANFEDIVKRYSGYKVLAIIDRDYYENLQREIIEANK